MFRERVRAHACFIATGLILLAVAVSGDAFAQATALTLQGQRLNPLRSAEGKATVLVFLRTDCPVSSRYAPVIQQISSRYARDVHFWLVYPDRAESPDVIRKYLLDYHYHLPALRDPEHALVKTGEVQITPEVAVFDRAGRLLYHGRIDNVYEDFGRARRSATTHELEDAVQSALTGKPLAKTYESGVGCYISDLK